MGCDHEDEDMRVARLPRYLFDAGFARVGILHRNSSPDSPRGLVLPGTFGVDRDTSLRRLGRDTRLPHEIAPVTEPARQRRVSVWKRPLLSALVSPRSCRILHQVESQVSHASPLTPVSPAGVGAINTARGCVPEADLARCS